MSVGVVEAASPDEDEDDELEQTAERPAFARRMGAVMSSRDMGWETPEEVLELVRMVGPIALDPCTTIGNPVGARAFVCPGPLHDSNRLAANAGRGINGDGLLVPWDDPAWITGSPAPGLVYVNPPYGRLIPKWAAKMRLEASGGVEIVALVPARVDTRWFQRYVIHADALCFWAGRLTFKGAPYTAPFPSVIAYYGDRSKAFRRVFSGKGWIP